MNQKISLLLVFGVICCLPLQATIILPGIFADNMVLQRDGLIPVWGRADAGEKIEVRFHHQVKSAKADKDGNWVLRLDAEKAGGPYDLAVTGKNKYRT